MRTVSGHWKYCISIPMMAACLFSSGNDVFEEEGMQIKLIGCQYVDIRSDALSEITELMNTFLEFQKEQYENIVMNLI